MKKPALILVGVVAVMFIASPVLAASAKFTALVDELIFSDGYSGSATLERTIKVPSKKDLLIGVSLQTGIYTQTKVKGKGGGFASESASGTIDVAVELWRDGIQVLDKVAPENGVTFDHRAQTLEAVLGGVLDSCYDMGTWSFVDDTSTEDPNDKTCVETGTDVLDGVVTIPCECYFTDEEINLILDTMGAHHFNFVAKNLQSGTYTVKVIVTGSTASDQDNTGETSEAKVGVGAGSVTIEVVRATNNPDGIEFVD